VKKLVITALLAALGALLLAVGYWLYIMMFAPGGRDGYVFAHSYALSKHGIGPIRENLYVETDSTTNELLLDKGNRWTGNNSSAKEAVIFFENKVWLPSALPGDFDLTKAVIISFEGDKVRFFDFGGMHGGYYERRDLK
jgi:hypothetical protein